MHEFSLCEGIVKQLEQANNGSLNNITTVCLEIGKLANVDIGSLSFWFPVVIKNKYATPIKLDILEIESQARCRSCLREFRLLNLYEACPQCGEFGNYEIIQGRELLIKAFYLKSD